LIFWLPVALRVAVNTPIPLATAALAGKVAPASVLLK